MKNSRGLPAVFVAGLSAGFEADSRARRPAGFTKLDLLVTMGILGILAGLATPGFLNWLPSYRLKGAARDLYSNLHLTKSRAIRDRGEWAIQFDAKSNTYQVVSGGLDRIYSTPEDNVVLKTVSLSAYGSGLIFGRGKATRKVGRNEPIEDCVSYPGDRVVFNPRGMTTGTLGGYAYLQNDRDACCAVGTWSSGIVVLRKWNGSGWE